MERGFSVAELLTDMICDVSSLDKVKWNRRDGLIN